MLKVGITGGIGSGKTYISNIFNLDYKIPIYDSDSRAKELMNTDKLIIDKLINWYGSSIYFDKQLNRKLLADIIFNDKVELNKVNNLVHPIVENDFFNWSKQYKHLPYILFESAILFDTDFYKKLDMVISVSSTQSTRVARILIRDNTTLDKILERIKNQKSDYELNKLSDFVIINENYDNINEQIRIINEKLLTLSEITEIL